MAESLVQVTEGTGKKLHTWSVVIGANTVEDEFVIPGEYPLATYSVWSNASIATANDHVFQLMAGASLKVRIRRLTIEQSSSAGAATLASYDILRLTSAGTGGTALTTTAMDTTDAGSGATAMQLPTVKGTEAARPLFTTKMQHRASVNANGAAEDVFSWSQLPNGKPIIIPAGTANGICVKSTTAVASASVIVTVEFVETSF